MAQTTRREPGNMPIPGFHLTEDQAIEMARRGIEPLSAEAIMRRQRIPDEVLTLSEEDANDLVTVVCFVDTHPWTMETPKEPARWLERGEQAEVPRKVAELMAERHQVTIIQQKGA